MTSIRFEIDGPVAVISIDRPERRNAVDGPTAKQLADAFRRFDADAELCVAVLTGAIPELKSRPSSAPSSSHSLATTAS